MTRPIEDRIQIDALGRDDADGVPDFFELLETAISTIQSHCGNSGWTDFNYHDPGVTLLEACVWSLVDLHYRAHTMSFTGPAIDLRNGEPGSEPLQPDPERLLDGFSTTMEEVLHDGEGRKSEGNIGPESDRAGSLDPTLVRQVRARLIQSALESDHERIAGAESHESRTADLERMLAGVLRERSGLEASPGELRSVLAMIDRRRFSPSTFEDERGRSRVWPPHPCQVLMVKPVTHIDYVDRLLRCLEDDRRVSRAWVVTGAIEGLRWDGTKQVEHDREQPGGISIAILPAGDMSTGSHSGGHEALLSDCRRAILGSEAGRTRKWWGHEDFKEPLSAERLIADELYFGVVRVVDVEVTGEVVCTPGESVGEIRRRVHHALAEFISPASRREASDSADDAGAAWDELMETAPDPRAGGWPLGSPVVARDVADILRGVRGVEEVSLIALRIDGGNLELTEAALPAFSVPRLSEDRLAMVSGEGVNDLV